MGFNIEELSTIMEKVYKDAVIKEQVLALEELKRNLFMKYENMKAYVSISNELYSGRLCKKHLTTMEQLKNELLSLYNAFDDKFMLFIIGEGKTGKSTLINALTGHMVAEEDFAPSTWKIDVYTPELKNEIIIKYIDGREIKYEFQEGKRRVEEEEQKSKAGRKLLNEMKRKELKKLKTSEERKEMEAYLTENYGYKEAIIEVRWPVKRNWLLDKCLLVDTPGMDQAINKTEQIGSITDYYHKADGALWLIDGTTVSSASLKVEYDKLQDALKDVGGIKDNIICVVNKVDIVRKNSGEAGIESVMKSADSMFRNRFSKIIGISAKEAYKGFSVNDTQIINSSGIHMLQETIREMFIAKADMLRGNAKEQGFNKLLNMSLQELSNYRGIIREHEESYKEKQKRYREAIESKRKDITKNTEDYFEGYLSEVDTRINQYIDQLANGERDKFIKDKIYKIDSFLAETNNFKKRKVEEIEAKFSIWKSLARISEYKYINEMIPKTEGIYKSVKEIKISGFGEIKFFSPRLDGSIFSMIDNAWGKFVFWLNKDHNKRLLRKIIKEQCDEIKSDIEISLNSLLQGKEQICDDILNRSFEEILTKHSSLPELNSKINQLEEDLRKKVESINIKDILI